MSAGNQGFTLRDHPGQNQPYCTGPQSEIRAKIVTQGDYRIFTLLGAYRL